MKASIRPPPPDTGLLEVDGCRLQRCYSNALDPTFRLDQGVGLRQQTAAHVLNYPIDRRDAAQADHDFRSAELR